MGIPLTRQLYAMLYAGVCGVLCGVFYDLFRLSRVLLGISEYTRFGRKLYTHRFPLIGSMSRVTSGKIRVVTEFWIVILEDVLFAAAAGCVFNVFLYQAASGCFRWFYLFFAGSGFLIYYFTVGRVVMLSSEILIYLLRLIARYVLYFIILPFRLVVWMIRICYRWFIKHLAYPVMARMYTGWCHRYTLRVKLDLSTQIRFNERG